jgi:hypothetical protein
MDAMWLPKSKASLRGYFPRKPAASERFGNTVLTRMRGRSLLTIPQERTFIGRTAFSGHEEV